MTLKSADLFKRMGPILATSGAEIVKKVQAVFVFEIKADKDAAPQYFTVDLKNGNGMWHLTLYYVH